MSTGADLVDDLMRAVRVVPCSRHECPFGNPRVFVRCAQRQRQGMQAGLEFDVQQRMHRARPGDPGLAVEAVRHQQDGIMRLAAGAGAGMAGMMLAVVLHADQRGGEMLAEQGFDTGGAGFHGEEDGEADPRTQSAARIGAAISTPLANPPSQRRQTCPQNVE